MTNNIERQIIEIIATDRIEIPISSMSGKLKRRKPKLAKNLDITEYDDNFEGERVYSRIEEENKLKARGMKAAIELFESKYSKHGKILRDLINEQRTLSEKYVYFGVNEGCRLTANDYMGVMTDLGFTEKIAEPLYQELINVSRKISKKRDEERSVLIGEII